MGSTAQVLRSYCPFRDCKNRYVCCYRILGKDQLYITRLRRKGNLGLAPDNIHCLVMLRALKCFVVLEGTSRVHRFDPAQRLTDNQLCTDEMVLILGSTRRDIIDLQTRVLDGF